MYGVVSKRLDYGKKYCHHSPSLEESKLQNSIVTAIMNNAKSNSEVLSKLKYHISLTLNGDTDEDRTLDYEIQIAKLDEEYDALLNQITADMQNFDVYEKQLEKIVMEKSNLKIEMEKLKSSKKNAITTQSRLDEIFQVIEGLRNHPLEFNNRLIRQIIDCIIVESKSKIKIVFTGGYEVEQEM